MSKYVLRSSLSTGCLMGCLMAASATASAGQLIIERTVNRAAPDVQAPAAESTADRAAARAANRAAGGAATPSAVAESAVAATPAFMLRKDQRLSEQVRGWLEPGGWQLRWDLSTDWVIPADVTMDATDALGAVDQLAKWMERQGAPVQFVAFERNKILEARSLQPRTQE